MDTGLGAPPWQAEMSSGAVSFQHYNNKAPWQRNALNSGGVGAEPHTSDISTSPETADPAFEAVSAKTIAPTTGPTTTTAGEMNSCLIDERDAFPCKL